MIYQLETWKINLNFWLINLITWLLEWSTWLFDKLILDKSVKSHHSRYYKLFIILFLERQADENPPNEDNPNENEPTISETFTIATDDQTDDEPSVNLEVETSITKSPTTTFIGGIPLSLITRPNTTTSTTMATTTTKSVAIKGKVTYYTKKPIIFPSETTTKFTVGPLVRQQATGLTSTSHKAKMVAPLSKNMKIVSTTKKVTTKKVQKKVEGTKKMTKTTLKAKMSTNSTAKTTIKGAYAKRIR